MVICESCKREVAYRYDGLCFECFNHRARMLCFGSVPEVEDVTVTRLKLDDIRARLDRIEKALAAQRKPCAYKLIGVELDIPEQSFASLNQAYEAAHHAVIDQLATVDGTWYEYPDASQSLRVNVYGADGSKTTITAARIWPAYSEEGEG